MTALEAQRFQQIITACGMRPPVALRPAELLKVFWEHHQTSLQENYPGISLQRLIQEWQTAGWYDEEEWYFFDPAHPLSKFLLALDQGVPWGYHWGLQFFYEAEFLVGPATLIPRPETELLVEIAKASWAQKIQQNKISQACWADVGTGCGNILLSLLPYAEIPVTAYGIDLNPQALILAQQNYFRLGFRWRPEHQVHWVVSDRLAAPRLGGVKFDLIVANPPYLKRSQASEEVHPQVQKFEPALALYLPDEEYRAWFAEFFQMVAEHLAPGGLFLMEGHSAYLQELADLAKNKKLKNVEILPDFTGRSRFLSAKV